MVPQTGDYGSLPTEGHVMDERDDYRSCIDACNVCAQACEQCAHATLAEGDLKSMSACIALCIDCAQACQLCAAYMSRGSLGIEAACRFCARLCELCADECAGNDMVHCQHCALACRRCASQCRATADAAAGEFEAVDAPEYG